MTEALAGLYLDILAEELVPAMGCTEPIAISYCAAKVRSVLGGLPERITVGCSGNIIKNVKSVIVPHTGGLKGIEAAAAAGVVAGREDRELEVISEVTPEEIGKIREYMDCTPIRVVPMRDCDKLDILITAQRGTDSAAVRISRHHTNVSYIERNGQVLFSEEKILEEGGARRADTGKLTVADIIEFADTVDISRVSALLDRQIEYNMAIAEEGLKGDWGANVGSVILASGHTDVRSRAKAMAAAGSDARMSGCELPVVINSGSGNQGITVSVPVVEYARSIGADREQVYRALLVSNLLAIHIKTGIGPLSAYCGAISAGCAAGCGIAYLEGGRIDVIAHTLVNSLATISGVVCDGAKPSCAAKIAAALDAAFLGYDMYCNGQQFYGGDGIVSKGVENTIRNIARLGSDGMMETDQEILRIMTE